MKPFYEIFDDKVGHKRRIPWDADRSTAKMHEMRNEVIAELNARDIERAEAAGIEIPEGITALPTCFLNSDGHYAIDPIASRIKHSGAEENDIFIPRWQEFCSRPRPDEEMDYPSVTYRPKQVRGISSPVVETTVQPKRGPGRPRKSAMQEV